MPEIFPCRVLARQDAKPQMTVGTMNSHLEQRNHPRAYEAESLTRPDAGRRVISSAAGLGH